MIQKKRAKYRILESADDKEISEADYTTATFKFQRNEENLMAEDFTNLNNIR